MGQKVHPVGFRLGVYEDWSAHWFSKNQYAENLQEDLAIRRYLKERLNNADISKIVIDKTGSDIRLTIHTASPGRLIGKRGQGIDTLKAELSKMFKKNIDISAQEVKVPDIDATIIAKNIAVQISKRGHYKRLMKKAAFMALKAGAKGIIIECSGRLAGAEIARTEKVSEGAVPRHTLRCKISYALAEAQTLQGKVGVRVFVNCGEYPAKRV